MHVLLDTHVLLWALTDPARLKPETVKLLTDRANEIYFSAISILEIAIKARLGRIDFIHEPADVVAEAKLAGFIELPMMSDVAMMVRDLPDYHKDPFDRVLIAQMLAGPYQLLTGDAELASYSPLVSIVNAQ